MEIHLERLGEQPFIWQETLELSPESLGCDEVVGLSPVDCRGVVRKLPSGYHLRADLAYEQELACTRCLQPIATPVESRIDLLLMTKADEEEPGERELEADELGVLHLRSPVFDTKPVLLEQLRLNVPMKTLCRDDCAGLCGVCGADLNAGSCDCAAPVDPRWSTLAGLRDRLDG